MSGQSKSETVTSRTATIPRAGGPSTEAVFRGGLGAMSLWRDTRARWYRARGRGRTLVRITDAAAWWEVIADEEYTAGVRNGDAVRHRLRRPRADRFVRPLHCLELPTGG